MFVLNIRITAKDDIPILKVQIENILVEITEKNAEE